MTKAKLLIPLAVIGSLSYLPTTTWADRLGVDAVINWGNGKAYFFRENQYTRYDIKADQADSGYPAMIDNHWPNLWAEGIDAAINWGNGKAYFFKGDQYIRYDIQAGKADPGYPATITDSNWPGLWTDGIDAAINWGNGKAYFFKGDQYIGYDIQADESEPDYPATITDSNWPGLWTDGIDAAVNWGNGKAYFFNENEYIRYDIEEDQADAGYPTTITQQNWPGLSFQAEVSSVWSTNWDRLYLTQNESEVSGHYVYYHKGNLISGQMAGTLVGNLLKGWWQESNQSNDCGPNQAWNGPLTFLFAEEGKSFVGDWGDCSESPDTVNPSDNTWNGSLLEGAFNIQKLVDRFSIWSTNWDRLYLIQTGSLVKGHYIYYQDGKPVQGQIKGVMESLTFNGWWKQSDQPSCGPDNAWDGPVTFVFAEAGHSFMGDWGGCAKTFETLNPSNKSWHGTFVEGQFQVKKLAEERPASSTLEEEQSSEVEEDQPSEVEEDEPSEVEDEQPSEVEEDEPSDVEDEQPSEVEEDEPSDVENEQPSEVEDEQSSEVEEDEPSDVEDEQPSEVEEDEPSYVEDEQPSEVEEDEPSYVEDEQPSEVEEDEPSYVEDEQPSEVEEDEPSDVEDEQPFEVEEDEPSDVENEQPSEVEDEQSSEVEEDEPSDVEDEQPSEVEEDEPSYVEDEQPSEVEEDEPSYVEDEQPSEVEEDEPSDVEDEQPFEVEDEQPFEVEEDEPSDVEDEQPSEVELELSSEWDTNWEHLSLTQLGSAIAGRYHYDASHGEVIGTLEGQKLNGWWRQSSQPHCGPDQAWDGPFTFQFAEDGQSFIGDWGGCQETHENMNPSNSTWNGKLVEGALNLSNVSQAVDESPATPSVPEEEQASEKPAVTISVTPPAEDEESTVSNEGVVALGCFKDDGEQDGTTGRDLDGVMWSDSQMTTEKCVQHCESQGYEYAGTQFSSQCFCGKNYGEYGEASNCDTPCKGNASQTCGGTWANTVYQIGKPQCFWMENTSGQFKWIPASSIYRKMLTKQECFQLDSCDGGEGLSSGGCYKWAASKDAPRIKW